MLWGGIMMFVSLLKHATIQAQTTKFSLNFSKAPHETKTLHIA